MKTLKMIISVLLLSSLAIGCSNDNESPIVIEESQSVGSNDKVDFKPSTLFGNHIAINQPHVSITHVEGSGDHDHQFNVLMLVSPGTEISYTEQDNEFWADGVIDIVITTSKGLKDVNSLVRMPVQLNGGSYELLSFSIIPSHPLDKPRLNLQIINSDSRVNVHQGGAIHLPGGN